jgi:sensor c-di-GMP phosphodiesterase-like protein
MNSTMLHDNRAAGLMNRVREDVSHLREDVGHLLSHTTRETLPHSAREIADQAKSQIVAGTAYATSRLRELNEAPIQQKVGWIGGALLVGILAAAGVYAFSHNGHSQTHNGSSVD